MINDYYTNLTAFERTQGVDDFGDVVTTDETDGVAFRGYIGKPSSAAVERMAQRGVYVTGRLYAPVDSPISELGFVRDEAAGATYQVVTQPRDVAGRGHHVECDLAEIKNMVR